MIRISAPASQERRFGLVSPLKKIGSPVPVSFVGSPGSLVFDPATETYSKGEGSPEEEILVTVRQTQGRADAERAGLDPNRLVLECRVVETEGAKPLRLPAGVKAGDSFPLPLRGKPGRAEILPTPDTQLPKVQAKLGEVFIAFWQSNE